MSMNSLYLYLRFQPFEYGLLPFSDPSFVSADTSSSSTLTRLRSKMHRYSLNLHRNRRINAAGISLCLGIMYEQAQLLLETFASVSPPTYDDAIYNASLGEIDSVGASIDDLIMFLYIQNYRRAPIRPHKDASLVEDVWPLDGSSSTTTATTATPTTTTPISISHHVKVRKTTTPSQSDEEAHQLAYMQKHLHDLLSLLAAPLENTCSDSQMLISQEQFNHLGFLIESSTLEPLSCAAPFFSESTALVPLQEVHDWVMTHLFCRSNHSQGRPTHCNDNGCSFIQDFTVIDGVIKVSFLKDESNIIGGSVKVTNCNDSTIYVLAPLNYVSIYGCSDCTVVLGAVGKAVRIEHCERVHLIVATVSICVANCRECRFNLAVNQAPVIFGENHSLQVAPYNTYYPKLEEHLSQVGFEPNINKWDEQLTFSAVDPHDSTVHAAGIADSETEGASLLPADHFTSFTIPKWTDSKSYRGSVTTCNPFMLPRAYLQSQTQRNKAAQVLREVLESLKISEPRKRHLAHVMRVHFKEWLLSSGNIRQLYEIQKDVE